MSGRHRKPTNTGRTVAKFALTGAVIGVSRRRLRRHGKRQPPTPTGIASHSASPAATGPSTPATATRVACSSPPAPGTPTAAASTPRPQTRPPASSRSLSPSASSPTRAGAHGRRAPRAWACRVLRRSAPSTPLRAHPRRRVSATPCRSCPRLPHCRPRLRTSSPASSRASRLSRTPASSSIRASSTPFAPFSPSKSPQTRKSPAPIRCGALSRAVQGEPRGTPSLRPASREAGPDEESAVDDRAGMRVGQVLDRQRKDHVLAVRRKRAGTRRGQLGDRMVSVGQLRPSVVDILFLRRGSHAAHFGR